MTGKATLIKIVISLLILGLVLYNIGIENIISTFLKINPIYLLLAYLVAVIPLFTHSYNMMNMIKPLSKISYRRILKFYTYGWAIGSFTPARLGEYSTSYFLKKDGVNAADSIAVLTIDKITTIVALFILSLYNLSLLSRFYLEFMVFFVVFIIIFAFFIKFKIFHLAKVDRTLNIMFAYIKNNKFLVLSNLFFSILKWSLLGLVYYIIFLSLGETIHPLILISSISLGSLVGLLPITFSGLGVREGVFISIMIIYGVDPSIAVIGSIVPIIIYYSVAVPIFIYLIKKIDMNLLKNYVSASLSFHCGSYLHTQFYRLQKINFIRNERPMPK